MKKLKLLTASAVLALGLGMSGSAMASIVVNYATLDGGAQWTNGGGFTDGDTVTVESSATIAVEINADVTPAGKWRATSWAVGTESGCNNHATDWNNTNNVTESFNITAPAAPETYNLTLTAREFDDCSAGNDSATAVLVDAIIVEAAEATLLKTLVSGPLTTSDDDPPVGCNGVAACNGFAFEYELDTGPNDAGAIGLNLDFSQHFVVEILITNEGGDGAINGNVIIDTFGADFDLDPTAEDDWHNDGAPAFPLDGDCGTGAGSCPNGGGHDGVRVVEGPSACTYEATQPPSGDGIGGRKEPEFIDIRVVGLLEDATCTVLVFVQTVENPGGGNEFFEPTGCRVLEYTTGNGSTGDDILDTFTLNEGLKEFDGTNGDRLSGPQGSLQLTCIPLPL